VTQPSAHGEIIIEAMVNTDGDVTSVKTTRNTTGSDALAFKNSAAIQGAKFYPIVVKGRRREFIYEYRVHY
jgi:outer membrane biosynthesis protein TonB